MNDKPKWGISEYVSIGTAIAGGVCIWIAIDTTYKKIVMPINQISISAGLLFLIFGFVLIIVALGRFPEITNAQNAKKNWLGRNWPALLLVLLVALFISYYMRGPVQKTPQTFKYDVLKDTLTITLAIIAIAVTAFGFLFYRIAIERIEREAGKFERETGPRIALESRKWIARLATSVGHSFWKMKSLKSLDEAIQLTKEAHDQYLPLNKLDLRDPENQLLVAAIRNNLASYFARAKREKDLARGYAKYIKSIAHKYPKKTAVWEKTCKEVLDAFPD